MTAAEVAGAMEEIKGYFTRMAITLRDKDPRESFRMFRCGEICGKAAEELRAGEETEPEFEGGGSSWWWVCGECRTMIDERDRFCRECGRRLKWDGTKTSGSTPGSSSGGDRNT